ncbi:hypothetical protein OG689_05515 [Kitasatospora sp. NBC_00240]|uniref:hypothetical protein n=1 Tax=Kitasatospora sp. NBC_00240 TaxID=2903567 RepID=UPI00224D43FA|nr:hypothetical protein [Kitasatospora sp. NBC_00240]MCX5208756.1 hypothetical protein [Kitasatospora sp. NBC_00240]
MTSTSGSREPSGMVHMSISGAPPVANVVADTVGQSFKLIVVPGPGAAGDYVSPADQVVRTRWQVDTSAPLEQGAARPVAFADAAAGPVKVELSGRKDAAVKVDALIRGRFRAGPPAGISQAFEVWPGSPPQAEGRP